MSTTTPYLRLKAHDDPATPLVWEAVADLGAGLRRWRLRKAQRRQLEALLEREDHVLHDIGTTRGEVRALVQNLRRPS